MLYGATVTLPPKLAPSSVNCTPLMARGPVAFALIVTCPVTVAPFEGAVMETTGAAALTVIVTLLVAASSVEETVTVPVRLALLLKLKVALEEPLGMTTGPLTESAGLLELTATVFATAPGPAIVTVHVPDWPAVTVVGLQARETGPPTAVSVVVAEELPTLAVTVTGTEPVNVPVLAVNVALVEFAATVRLEGTVRTLTLLPE